MARSMISSQKLKKNPAELPVLGDGRQTKPYLYVSDLIDAIELAWSQIAGAARRLQCGRQRRDFGERHRRNRRAHISAGRTRKIAYAGGDRGWPGDVPRFSYNTEKLRALGWVPKFESTAAVRHTVERIAQNGF